MPPKHAGCGRGGKKLKFPPVIPPAASPEPQRYRACANMASQTDPLEGPGPSIPGIPEVMVAIATCQSAVASCQVALTSKIEAVQLDVGLI